MTILYSRQDEIEALPNENFDCAKHSSPLYIGLREFQGGVDEQA